MEQNKRQMLIGCVLFLLGLLALLASLLHFDCRILSSFVFGSALLFLYKTKQKKWALLTGCVALTACFSRIIFKVPIVGESICTALFIGVPSIVYIYVIVRKTDEKLRYPGRLIFATFTAWTGIYIALASFSVLQFAAGSLFFFCSGMAAFCIYFLTNKMYGTMPVAVGAICFFFVIICMKGNPHLPAVLHYSVTLLSLALIVISVIMIIETIKEKHKHMK